MPLIPDHDGTPYRDVLRQMHALLAPRTYLEVGTLHGSTLQLAQCPSIAVDPKFQITGDLIGEKSRLMLFQMGSDEFFSFHDPVRYLGSPVELAFLDGMHWSEFLLRDFINIERHCRRRSVVVLHDCLPADQHVARRDSADQSLQHLSAHPDWWTGDVWLAVDALRKHRPDLDIRHYNAPPTGLVVVTNLDPTSTVLPDRYLQIVRGWEEPDNTGLESFLRGNPIENTSVFSSLVRLSRRYWF